MAFSDAINTNMNWKAVDQSSAIPAKIPGTNPAQGTVETRGYVPYGANSDVVTNDFSNASELTADEQSKILGREVTPAGTADAPLGNDSPPETATDEASQAAAAAAAEIPEYTPTVNLLHAYPSYTYNISLHLLTPDDFNKIVNNPESPYVPSAVLISSAGRYTADTGDFPRHPEFQGVDFFFDNLSLETVIGHNSDSQNTNAIHLNFTLIEPYGMTLLNRIMAVSSEIGEINFRQLPYLLQIDFFGHDDDGNPTKIATATKHIPIQLIEMKIKLTNKGTEYVVEAVPFNHQAFSETVVSTPIRLEVTASTVGEFFLANDGVSEEYRVTSQNEDRLEIGSKSISDKNDAQTRKQAQFTKTASMEARDKGQAGGSLRTEAEASEIINEMTTRINAPVTVHSYTGAINGWLGVQFDEGKTERPDVISFVVHKDIAEATFPAASKTSPENFPMRIVDTTKELELAKKEAELAQLKEKKAAAGTTNSTLDNYIESLEVTIKQERKSTPANQNGNVTKMYSDKPDVRVMAINQGTSIIEAIGLAIRGSSYISNQVASPDLLTATPAALAKLNNAPLKWFKVIPKVEIIGFDSLRNVFAKHFTYQIVPCIIYNYTNENAPKGRPKGYVKDYQYMFTGNNSDIIDLDLEFNTMYYVAKTVAAINAEKLSAAQDTVDRGSQTKSGYDAVAEAKKEEIRLQSINQALRPDKALVNTSAVVATLTSKDDVAREIQNTLNSPGADLLRINMKIVGDPDFIKQDDIFYSGYKTLDEWKEANFKTTNGSLVTDLGQIFVNVTFKTPNDYDETGLARPVDHKYAHNMFSGRYQVLTVKSTFSGGKFIQELLLIYYANQPTTGYEKTDLSTTSLRPSSGDAPIGGRSMTDNDSYFSSVSPSTTISATQSDYLVSELAPAESKMVGMGSATSLNFNPLSTSYDGSGITKQMSDSFAKTPIADIGLPDTNLGSAYPSVAVSGDQVSSTIALDKSQNAIMRR